MKKYLFILAVLFSVFSQPAYADSSISIETSVSSSRVELGDQVTMDLIVSNAPGKISDPGIGTIDGFTAYSQGHSQEISVINGQVSSRSVFSYVLVANSIGKKKIGPFQVTVDGKIYKAAAVEVEVVSSGSISSNAPQPVVTGPPATPHPRALPAGNVTDKDIFVQAWIDKDEVYVNEPVMLTYTFYTRLSATYKGFEKEPATTGFWVEDFPPEKTIQRTEKILDGSRYVVADVRKIALFPTAQGIFSLEPGTLSADVEIRDNDPFGGGDPFNSFFSSNIFGSRRGFPGSFMSQIVSKNIVVAPVKITVKALPAEGKPSNFSGAVGNYLMESSVDKNTVQTGDPVTYRLRIWGQGNLNTLQMPIFPKLDDFKVYDSSSSANVSKEKLRVEGEKIAETVIVPKKPGTFRIPAISFSYFDPKDGQYKVMKTETQTIKVTGAVLAEEDKPTTTSSNFEPTEKEDVAVLAKDIHFIKTNFSMNALSGHNFYQQPVYWVLGVFFLLGWILMGFFLVAQPAGGLTGLKETQFRRSHAIAKHKLKDAKRMLLEEKQDAFYAEISRAVYGYFGGRLGISPQAVTLTEIEKKTGEELGPELFNDIKKLFEELSAARFAMSKKTKEEMQELYALADRAITFFERVKIK